MKPKLTQSILMAPLAMCLLMLSTVSMASATGDGDPKERTEEKEETTHSKVSSSRNNSSVKIYPDILKRVMHVVAKDNDGHNIDFFVFDLQGTIVQHYKMKSGDHQKIAGLDRGRYVFSVFEGDEETATGKFDIR